VLRAGDEFCEDLEIDPPSPITADMADDFLLAWTDIAKEAVDRFVLVVERRLESERAGTMDDVLE